MSAIISDCGKYRYELRRQISDNPPKCVFIMLNPSTADAENDDPTIRRCKGFAAALGCGELIVVNLFAFRTTMPRLLHSQDDPVGPENRERLSAAVRQVHGNSGHVICAWGTHGKYRDQDKAVMLWLKEESIFPQCFHDPDKPIATNKDGTPKHPLYLPSNSFLVTYTGRKP